MAKSRLLRRRMRVLDQELTAKPDSALVDYLHIPEKFVSPGERILASAVVLPAEAEGDDQ